MDSPVTARQVAVAGAALTALAVIGTLGFALIVDEPLVDSFYRTVNTLTTTGAFLPPDGTAGKLFAIVMMVAGVALFLYLIGLLIELVVGGVATGTWQHRRMNSRIAQLRNHHIICGYGRVGSRVVRELDAASVPFVVLDSGREALERAREDGVLHLDADGSDDDALTDAGIAHAAGLVACVDDDAVNLYIVLTAKGLRPDLHVVARASSERAVAKLERAGADQVVSPYTIAGERIAGMVATPAVAAYLSDAAGAEAPFSLAELELPGDWPQSGVSIRELGVREHTGALILGVRKAGGAMLSHPGPDTTLAAGDVVIGVGTEGELQGLRGLFRTRAR